MPDDPSPIPPRFREAAFRFYEPTITRIVSAYPAVLVFDPRKEYELSPVTFAQRLRDAMTSFRKYNWPSSYLNHAKFCELDIVVSESDDGTVRVGSKESLKEVIINPNIAAKTLAADTWELNWVADAEEVTCVVKLCHRRRLMGLKILVSDLPAEMVSSFEASHDVAFAPVEGRPNTYNLI